MTGGASDDAVDDATERIAIGASSCLCGCALRWDGGSFDHLETLEGADRAFAVTPVCPEVAAGFGVPREPVRLTGTGEEVLDGLARAVDARGEDVTDAFIAGAEACVERLEAAGVRAVVLKERSPSCGVEATPAGEEPGRVGAGVFAALARRRGLLEIPSTVLEDPAAWAAWRARIAGLGRTGASEDERSPGVS